MMLRTRLRRSAPTTADPLSNFGKVLLASTLVGTIRVRNGLKYGDTPNTVYAPFRYRDLRDIRKLGITKHPCRPFTGNGSCTRRMAGLSRCVSVPRIPLDLLSLVDPRGTDIAALIVARQQYPAHILNYLDSP